MWSVRAGMTLRLCEALIIVGESVIASSGSIIVAASGSTARATSSAPAADGTDPDTAPRNASTSGISVCSGRSVASRSMYPAALTSAALSVALTTPHAGMPMLVLTSEQRQDIISYILSLKANR